MAMATWNHLIRLKVSWKPKSVITYVYKEVKEEPSTPTGNVYVHYVDEFGNTLKNSVTDEYAQQ